MSKRINLLVGLLVGFGLTAGGILIGSPSGAAKPQRGTVAGTTRNAAIVAATAAMLKETSDIRQLTVLRPVKSGEQSRADIERMLIKKLDEEMTQRETHAAEVTLKKFGLAPPGFAYRPFIIKLLTEQVAGYYDTKERAFHLADWLELEIQKPVMAHELTHALQDQHFNLRKFEKWPEGDADAELAAHALIEGDATLAMTLYMAKNPLVALAFVRSVGSGGVSSEQFNRAPRALRETLIFPYMHGVEWATQIYRKGGWRLVSQAYSQLPLSSEQVLHPEKYFSYERPVTVTLPDLTSLLNRSSNQQTANSKRPNRRSRANKLPTTHRLLRTSNWRCIDYDVNGEWGYYLILDQFLKSAAESKRAAAGWAGDRYALYEKPETGEVFLAHLSSWDTEEDAREFFDSYVKRTVVRYPAAALLTGIDKPSADTLRRWQTSEGSVVVELLGSRVLVLEGVPEGIDDAAVRKALV
jgi:hypothetical protein